MNRTRFAHACLPFENSSRNSGQSGPGSFIIVIIFDDYVTDGDDVDDNEFDYDYGDADWYDNIYFSQLILLTNIEQMLCSMMLILTMMMIDADVYDCENYMKIMTNNSENIYLAQFMLFIEQRLCLAT